MCQCHLTDGPPKATLLQAPVWYHVFAGICAEQCLCINSDYALKSTPTSTPAAVCAGSHQDVDQHRCMPDAIELALDLRASKSFIKCNHASKHGGSVANVHRSYITSRPLDVGQLFEVLTTQLTLADSACLRHLQYRLPSIGCQLDSNLEGATTEWSLLLTGWHSTQRERHPVVQIWYHQSAFQIFNNVAGNSAATW